MPVRIQGGSRLRRTLKKAGLDMGELTAANRRIASTVADTAAGRAPKRTGRLARDVRGQASKTRARIAAGRSSVPYAGPINYGWPDRHIEANPFLNDSATDEEPMIVGLYFEHVEKACAQVRGA